MNRLTTFFATALVAALAATGIDAKTLKVGLVLPGPITDGTFNTAAHKGIKLAEKKFDIKVSIQENTTFAQSQEAMLNYARDGYDIVIGHGFQFAEPATKIHKQYPKTWFVVTTAKVGAAPNLASFDNRWGDAGYVAGAVAAIVSKTGTIGHIGGIPVPVIQEYNEGWERGAKRFRPGIKVLSAYVGSFSDVAKGKEVTKSLIERGADVVSATGNESVLGTIQAAKEAGAMVIGTAFDAAGLAPDTIVTTALVKMETGIELLIGKVLDGTIKPRNYLLGFNDNGLGLSGYGKFATKISDADKARVRRLIADIRAGKIEDLPKIR